MLIYGGKTSKRFPLDEFLECFFPGANLKHYSNEKAESIKFLDDIEMSYLESERKRVNRPGQYGLAIIDVFKGEWQTMFLGTFIMKKFYQIEQITSSFEL